MSQPDDGTRWEELKVTGDQLVATVKELVREGNVRRVVIRNEEGRVYLEIPLTVGVVGALFVPVLAALGVLAAVASGLTIAVEKVVRPEQASGADGTPTDPTGDDGPA